MGVHFLYKTEKGFLFNPKYFTVVEDDVYRIIRRPRKEKLSLKCKLYIFPDIPNTGKPESIVTNVTHTTVGKKLK